MVKLKSKTETFFFTIDDHAVEITFKDKKFSNATFNFKGIYDRQHWNVLEKINKVITYIEKKYNQGVVDNKPLLEKIKEENHL
jgi:hypothetical protein